MAIFAKLYRAQLLYSAQLHNAHKVKQFTQNFQRPAKHTLMAVLFATLCACTPNDATQGTSQAQDSAKTSEVTELLNVSYDVSRDFYKEYNPLFIQHIGKNITINQSHGGSSKQALSVANGLQADVVTMNQASDIDMLAQKGLVDKSWQSAYPNHSAPFTSTIVFVVKKGNPKNIQDWQDLTHAQIVMANPKSTGNGRYAFLALLGASDGDDELVKSVLKNVAVYENGGRAASTTFMQRQIGDVLITFENEARMLASGAGMDTVQIVYPRRSVLAENPVAVVQSVASKRGSDTLSKQYLDFLYSNEAQRLAAKLHFRPQDETLLKEYNFTPIETFRPTDKFGDWGQIMALFADGGKFDTLAKK